MPNLDSITICGFKSFKKLTDFHLNALNVIVGANGAGKSNFIELFHIIPAMIKKNGLREYVAGNADTYFFRGPKETPEIEIQLKFGKNSYDFALIPTDEGFLFIKDEKIHSSENNGDAYNFTGGSFSAQLPDILTLKASRYIYDAITQWKVYHFHDTEKLAGMRRYCDVNNSEKLDFNGSNIAAFLYAMRKKEATAYKSILETIRLVIPFLDDFILTPDNNEQIRLSWRQKGLNDFPMKPTQLSDGTMRFICLATALMQPKLPSTIILDEPELGLHPEAIRIVAELIKSAAKRTQVIIATQSPLLLDEFSIEDIIVANRRDGTTTFERLQEKNYQYWLDEYSIGELWTKNVIAGGAIHE